ncbi:MAG: hypothetical protein HQ567_34760 [Candidatus Nealsonbacteria bacterium]|nr:hypothetical protein [Candidatus Nealsonbacteria bacterium]
MALPLLLFVMALMINFGTVACWKVRALSVGRNAVWSTRWPRTGNSDPRPRYWPESADVSAAGAGNVPELDDPRIDQPVARGPQLPLGTTVNADLLDPTRGLRRGEARITRDFPLLAKMGPYDLDMQTHILDDKWQYQRMGLSSNAVRRIPVIYALAKAPQGLANAYVQAVIALLNAPFRPQLTPLDNDDEFDYYRRLLGRGGGAPDFHPRLRSFSTLDMEVAMARVQDLIDRIQGRDAGGPDGSRVPSVAEVMSRAFIGLYRSVIRHFEALMEANPRLNYHGQIGQLEAKISVLERFLETLRN